MNLTRRILFDFFPDKGSLQSQPGEHFLTLPLVSQNEENICLPLVINIVSKYWGEEISLIESEQIARKYPETKGSIMMEGIELAERHGLLTYIYRSSIRDLKKRIDQGIPPIVILPGIQETVQHASIVSGYNPDERRLLTYIPQPDTIGAIPEVKFEQDWEQDDMVALILIPQDIQSIIENENLRFKESNKICFQAEKMRHQGKHSDALKILSNAVKIDNDNAQAWYIMGSIFNEINSQEAVSCYERSIKSNPKYYLAYRGLGNYHLKKKDYFLAESYYTRAIEINPYRFGPIFKNRAIAKLQLGDKLGCKIDLRKYLEQVPNAIDRKDIEDALKQL
jgi:tetratricopeptide (TPR) repeat protein